MSEGHRFLDSFAEDAAHPLSLSVVVAAQDARLTVSCCLEALERQKFDGIAEVILVDNSRDGTADLVRRDFPWVTVVEATGRRLIPELWGEGMLRATQPIVALLTGQAVPSPGWARAHLQAHQSNDWAAVGGPIALASGLGSLDLAVYWLRFARWNLPSFREIVPDVAGDNASYRVEVIAPYRDRIRAEGFWENEINHELRRGGRAFFASREAACDFAGGTTFWPFARQRLIHGRRFGARRLMGATRAMRALRIVSWPGTPLVFLYRLFGQARESGAVASFIRALPALWCCLGAWSVGELLGYLAGSQGIEERSATRIAGS